MIDRLTYPMVPAARWARRIGLFSAVLLILAIPLHRFGALTTPVALNTFAAALGGAVLAILAGLIALAVIWWRGHAGAIAACVGLFTGLAMLAWPLAYFAMTSQLPRISDVTTDTETPPQFQALGKRLSGMNPATYAGPGTAQAQLAGYPDLRTFLIDRPVEEAFELVEETVRKLRWRVVAADPPVSRPAKPGRLEASEQTLIIGFWDDVVVRVEGSANRARVDVRSSSRYGRFDFGQNAGRVRRFLAELQTRVDAAGPNGGRRSLRTTRSGATVKKGKAEDPQKAAPAPSRDRAPSGAPRERAPKETQR
ncbi:MAG: DUF1499 domain-containing protein [Hyphomicrobiaceae bacterium]|nr:DUF1499 domain-containing protein [Hyphomicrobiaceae bacterium]